MLEKVELMPSSNLCTNLLATKLLTQLATFPHPLLRSVLIQPDIVCQPSIRTLPSALEALRTKLDNVMPTLSGAEEAISLARRFLQERIDPNIPRIREQQPQSTVASTFSQLGECVHAMYVRLHDLVARIVQELCCQVKKPRAIARHSPPLSRPYSEGARLLRRRLRRPLQTRIRRRRHSPGKMAADPAEAVAAGAAAGAPLVVVA